MKRTKNPIGRPTKENPRHYLMIRGTDGMYQYLKSIQPDDLDERMRIYILACEKYQDDTCRSAKERFNAPPRVKKPKS